MCEIHIGVGFQKWKFGYIEDRFLQGNQETEEKRGCSHRRRKGQEICEKQLSFGGALGWKGKQFVGHPPKELEESRVVGVPNFRRHGVGALQRSSSQSTSFKNVSVHDSPLSSSAQLPSCVVQTSR